MSRPLPFGIIRIAAADLRRAPAHEAELSSQILLGEVVRVRTRRTADRWVQVETVHDRYRGWIKTWSFVLAEAEEARLWLERARHRISRPFVEILDAGRTRTPLMPAFFGSRVRRLDRGKRVVSILLPEGRRGALPAAALAPAATPGVDLARRLESFAGVPYLWGGRTPAGFDCSGLVQVALAEQRIGLPRDARDQLQASRRLAVGERPRRGDLVFFGRPGEPVSHVGILLDSSTYVHCRGWVRTASLDPESPLCDRDLLPQLRAFARPSGAARKRLEARSRRVESP